MDVAEFEAHRSRLVGHCYRMLGSASDADDAVQETMLRAWKSRDSFDGRATVRTWLYRIATNVCLDQLRGRRVRAVDDMPVGTPDDELTTRPREHWIEPIPDARVVPADASPEEQAQLRQSIRLAFVAALQYLPPKQRAALLLTEVLGWSAAEVGEVLDTSVASVNSALQRARAALAAKPAPREVEAAVVDAYFKAFSEFDVDALVRLLTADATLSMPPFALWLQGHAHIEQWLRGPGAGCRGSILRPVAACGQPAFAQWRDGGATPWALLVLDVSADGVTSMTSFLDVETVFPRFGVPMTISR